MYCVRCNKNTTTEKGNYYLKKKLDGEYYFCSDCGTALEPVHSVHKEIKDSPVTTPVVRESLMDAAIHNDQGEWDRIIEESAKGPVRLM